MTAKPKTSARERILEAAEQVAMEVGAGNLTLDAVAAVAGVSKGGLLYHFGGKEALLKGMIDRHMDEEMARVATTHTQLGGTPATYLRAFIEAMALQADKDAHPPAASRSFLAAAANSPSLLDRPRRQIASHYELLRTAGGNFPLAAIASLALDGLYFSDIFEMTALSADEREQLTTELLKLADAAAPH